MFLLSCNKSNVPTEIERVLKQAGSNRLELEKVIERYNHLPEDSLKLKAAYFLISNMEGQYYYEGKLLDHYQDYIKLISNDKTHGTYFLTSFESLYGPFTLDKLNIRFDIREITSEQLIQNIEAAFKVWIEQPWGRDISFENFCEYILPFRISNEVPEYNRLAIYEQFNGLLDSVRQANGDAVAACIALNNELKKTPIIHTTRVSFLPHFPASKLIKYRAGACRERTDLAVYVMRAVGIPVGIDFVPQWPWRSMGHEINFVLDKQGTSILFMGCEDNPGYPHFPGPGRTRAKVYRNTYSKNPLSLAMQKNKEEAVPSFLRNPRIMDVTDEFVECYDISVHFSSKEYDYAYLGVFDDSNWVPVHWGKIQNNISVFSKMQGDAVYLPCNFDASGIIPAGDPFILDTCGRVTYLTPNTENPIDEMILTDNYNPLFPDNFRVDYVLGGRFQGANHPDFNLHTISIKPFPQWNEIQVYNKDAFRFVRYVSPPNQYCRIGEIEFYSGNRKLKGKIMGVEEFLIVKDHTKDMVFDNDITSYFQSKVSSEAWVGLDLGKQLKIEKIRFVPAFIGPPTRLIQGHEYELFYWQHGNWISLGRKIAKDNKIYFRNIPSTSLYFLHDITTKLRERIFTYEHGRQVWW